ncbi:MBL fold metallo-hydrolase [Propionivibrio sp.]|uniref:MBL fold metallo-hydrolase n=1 Tax=Propionivibrio sp. TaxID=2212460 RepID=UPI00261D846F|nr:MBL fold metallo-hydrolase [Propionivibrio sp.]
MGRLISYEHGIYAFDSGYVRPLLASVHLIVENGRAAFVDTGSNESLPAALKALDQIGLSVNSVDYVILTHIHLDHAGGAGAMMQAFPHARLVVHPRGARHMADPSKLIEGASAVYGADEVRRLYGEVLPIAASRIIEATHELKIDLAGREFLCLDTPGHARHHICIVDGKSGHLFTGDTFGLSYRELDTAGRQFIFPTTTPIQFDPEALHASIDLITSYRPEAVYLTHFSQVKNVPEKALQLHRLIEAHLAIARREKKTGQERHSRIRSGLAELLLTETKLFGCPLPPADILEIFATDLDLNAQGLAVWVDTEK